MIALFSEKEIDDSYATKRKMDIVWWLLFIVYLATAITLVVINIVQISTVRSRAVYKPFLITMIVYSIVFWCATIFFRSTKYRMTKKYCAMLEDMEFGVRYRGEGTFVEVDKEIKLRDGVYFYTIILESPAVKIGDDSIRRIYVERNHALPTMEKGDKFKYITHSNRLIAYEIEKANNENTNQENEGDNAQ